MQGTMRRGRRFTAQPQTGHKAVVQLLLEKGAAIGLWDKGQRDGACLRRRGGA